jgi:hypothetical protein
MPVRRTYQLNTNGSTKGDGLLLNQPCDVHGKLTGGGYPWMIDVSGTGKLDIGDYTAYKTGSLSLPSHIVGGLEGRTRQVSASDNITADDLSIFCDSTGADRTLTLPAISTVPGKIVFVNAIGTGNFVYITVTGGDTIEGTATIQLDPGNNCILMGDNAAGIWRVLSRSSRAQTVIANSGINTSTTSGSFVDIAAGVNLYFSGKPCLFLYNANVSNVHAGGEIARAEYSFRFDNGGTDYFMGAFLDSDPNTYGMAAGSKVQTPPSAGQHIITARWRRTAGAGTITMDASSQFKLSFIEMN